MKKISLILILLMVLFSTTLVASAGDGTCYDPFDLLNKLDDGCYNVNATGYYNINPSCPVADIPIPTNIPTSMNVTVNSTVHKSGNTVTLTSVTSNPSLPAPFSSVAVDITNFQFVNSNIVTWITYKEIGFSANLKYNGNTVPVIGVAEYDRYENGLFIFHFKSLTIGATTIDDRFIEGKIKVSVTKFDCENSADIPEFPTIAIPVAAIIGLAFFMQRRKD